jgi:hypothetical protein
MLSRSAHATFDSFRSLQDPFSAPGNPVGSRIIAMPYTTADIGIQLLMDTTAALQEIEARMTARAFGAVQNPEQGPAVRQCWRGCWRCWMPAVRME